ncbi:hypothetical protein [Mycobacterium avium]|uniref:hypothetical protein n=1 Tax=Mycobacterium avium TaxID=1764 RepID=UPI000B3616DE|nr:hypothetical protein [Mycobacterium avium]
MVYADLGDHQQSTVIASDADSELRTGPEFGDDGLCDLVVPADAGAFGNELLISVKFADLARFVHEVEAQQCYGSEQRAASEPAAWQAGPLHTKIEPLLREAARACTAVREPDVTNAELAQWCEIAVTGLRAASRLARTQASLPGDATQERAEMAVFDDYPWVVWNVTVRDPDRVAGEDVAQRTAAVAAAAVQPHGCVYEYCVDDDEMSDGTKYFSWLVGVTQLEHQRCEGSVPVVISELVRELLTVLPVGLDRDERWTLAPDLYATRQRNEVYGGYGEHQ